jgi:hypothetical protein
MNSQYLENTSLVNSGMATSENSNLEGKLRMGALLIFHLQSESKPANFPGFANEKR